MTRLKAALVAIAGSIAIHIATAAEGWAVDWLGDLGGWQHITLASLLAVGMAIIPAAPTTWLREKLIAVGIRARDSLDNEKQAILEAAQEIQK